MRRIGFAVGTLVAGTALVVVAGVPSVYTTGDAAVAIPDNSMGVITACQTINVPDSGTIGDVNVEVTSAHSWVGDVTFELTSPAATTVTIMNRPARTGTGAGNSDDLQDATPIQFNEGSISGLTAEEIGNAPCGGLIDGSADCPDNYSSAPDAADTPIAGQGTSLADFNGEDFNGTWTLCAADSAGGDTGTLTSWSISFDGGVPVELQSISVE
jgi:subtilisin-like proprotein convertase family protein